MRPAYSGPLATGSTPFRMQGKSYARSDSDRLKRAVLTGVCGQSATHGMVQPSQGSGLEAAILERRYFPRAIAAPRVAFEGLLPFALRRAHWAGGEARGALRHQPAWARPSATAQLHLHRAGCARLGGPDTRRRRGRARQRRGQPGRDQACQEGGRSLADCFSHTAVRSRPRWTPVWWANIVASARQPHWAQSEPCWSGSGATMRPIAKLASAYCRR
jgi:hypothetical protein